ncbi:MAG: hypothetical protein ACLQBX_08530 [Candidatus Limnocylindrales bacterium]
MSIQGTAGHRPGAVGGNATGMLLDLRDVVAPRIDATKLSAGSHRLQRSGSFVAGPARDVA